MARWTVVDGDQELVIEARDGGRFSLQVVSGAEFVTGAAGLKDLHRKVSIAIGIAQAAIKDATNEDRPRDEGTASPGGE